MDKNYWENYYKSTPVGEKPSLFAQFVLDNYLKSGESLIELGCGNGRDGIFFSENGLNVLAVDQCAEEIEALQDKSGKENLKFLSSDFTQLDHENIFDNIYSRFTLHSISEEQENRVIDWSYKSLNKGGHIFIEARGHKNEIYKLGEKVQGEEHAYIYNNHYRRFVNKEDLVTKLRTTGFELIFEAEEKGFAPYENTDYTFMRVIALKK
jgi:cyclopropane fatty-acyl-phospholipid synthase-like methyltransferase